MYIVYVKIRVWMLQTRIRITHKNFIDDNVCNITDELHEVPTRIGFY